MKSGPHFEGGSQLKGLAPDRFYATVGYPLKKAGEVLPYVTYLDSKKIAPLSNLSEDLTAAARAALIEMIEWLKNTKGYSGEQAYVITSAACDLRIGNLVDVPNYAVSAICPLEIFDKK
jgi:formamidase